MEVNKIAKYFSSSDEEMVELGLELARPLRPGELYIILTTYLHPSFDYVTDLDEGIKIYKKQPFFPNFLGVKDPTKLLKLTQKL